MEDLVHRRTVIVRLVALLLIGAITTACTDSTPRVATLKDLQADTAAAIRLAGADELAHLSRDRENIVDGPTSAFDARIFGAQVGEDQVIAFYQGELRKLGWTSDNSVVTRSTTDLRVRGWCRSDLTFRLAIKDQAVAFDRAFYKGKTYVTVFDAGLVAALPGERCVR